MTWPLGLSRFIHGFSSFDEPSCGARAPDGKRLVETDRQARLLPAVIATLLDFDGRLGAWPPTSVAGLLDWADCGREQRRMLEHVLLDGLAALDERLLFERHLRFEVLSPVLRRHVLNAFARGELGVGAEAAKRFMDGLVEAATCAFLNFELTLAPLPGVGVQGERRA